jgi:hypothetical protein
MPLTPDSATAIVEASRLLFTTAVMSHSGHGNLSARLAEDRFLLTATGMIRDLSTAQLATVGTDGQVLEGELGPENAEIVAMHSVVYQARSDVGGIVHTHSPAATAFALANRPLPCRTEPLLRFGQAEEIPVVPWGRAGRTCRCAVSPPRSAPPRRPTPSCSATTGCWHSAPIPRRCPPGHRDRGVSPGRARRHAHRGRRRPPRRRTGGRPRVDGSDEQLSPVDDGGTFPGGLVPGRPTVTR